VITMKDGLVQSDKMVEKRNNAKKDKEAFLISREKENEGSVK